MTWVFCGHYENQFVVAQNELAFISLCLANISSALSSLRAALKIVSSGWGSNFASFLINWCKANVSKSPCCSEHYQTQKDDPIN